MLLLLWMQIVLPGRMVFLENSINFVGSEDLFAAVQEFFLGIPIPQGIASTSIVLLPKKDSPATFGDFRPISMCNFVNKVFTRILCARLQPILPRLITEEQSAFVKGRGGQQFVDSRTPSAA